MYLQLALLFLFDQLCGLNFQQRVFKPKIYQKPRCGEAKAANRQPLIDRLSTKGRDKRPAPCPCIYHSIKHIRSFLFLGVLRGDLRVIFGQRNRAMHDRLHLIVIYQRLGIGGLNGHILSVARRIFITREQRLCAACIDIGF